MQRRNICKFTSQSYSENLSVPCFVMETEKNIMQTATRLSHYRLILIIKGDGRITLDDNNIETNYMYIDFDGPRAEELLKRFNINKSNRHFAGFDGLIPLWEESLARASKDTIDLVSESIVIYTFSRLDSNSSVGDSTINKIIQITEEQFNNFDLSISLIAQELGYNPKYLSYLFKKKTNKTYSEYLRCIRIKYAISLFDNGINSVKNVALLSGFNDPLYFSSVFKNTRGLSPKEYIKYHSQDPTN